MREAIGGTWLFQIVIIFILLFTSFMCLTINKSKAFAVKDDIIETIEKYNGFSELGGKTLPNELISDISSKLKNSNFRSTGNCSSLEDSSKIKYYGFDYTGKYLNDGKHAAFCIGVINVKSSVEAGGKSEWPDSVYYKVGVFYQLDLPVFTSIFNFHIMGDTKVIYSPGRVR